MEFDWKQLFDQFNTQESFAILFFMIVAFLFGLLVGYLSRGRKIRQLRRELKKKTGELADAQTQVENLQEQLSLKEADIKKGVFERGEAEAKVLRLEEDHLQAQTEIIRLRSESEKSQVANRAYLSTIEDLNNQILGLKTKNEQLIAELTAPGEDRPPIQVPGERLLAVEAKLQRLEEENRSLHNELDELKKRGLLQRSGMILAMPQEEEPELDLNPDKSIVGDRIILDQPEKDNLTLISGLGPFLEKKLNDIGVFTYEQVSQWDAERIEKVTEAIGFLKGRIEKDDWVGQAARLHQLKLNRPGVLRSKEPPPANSDDLTIIEGIGPVIEKILQDAGIYTWENLAEAVPGHIREILDAAGDHFRIHDPATWPAQARLAANGDWGLLREYQEQLKGGKNNS